jgi:putative heme-binding domain-containing protein
MQNRVLSTATDHQRAALEPLLKPIESDEEVPIVFPKGPPRPWTVEQATTAVGTLRFRDFGRGAGLYRSTTCITCHQFNGKGSNVGPDLTSVGSTYSKNDLLRAIIEPSHAVTDQYAVSVVTKTSGEQVSGLIVEETEDHVTIAPNFVNAQFTTTIPRAEITSIELSPVSPMPEGLINPLNENELRDLIAYLISAGDPTDPMFKQ